MDSPQPTVRATSFPLGVVFNYLKIHSADYFLLFSICAVIIGLDQWTKALVRSHLALEQMWMPLHWLAPYARIVHWKNTGAAFGMLQQFGGVFAVLAVIVAIIIILYYPQVPASDWYLRLAMGLQLGGALGNLIDRIRVGWVTDFISIGNFAVFNIADASISVGVAVLIVGMFVKEWKEKKRTSQISEASKITSDDPQAQNEIPTSIPGSVELASQLPVIGVSDDNSPNSEIPQSSNQEI